MDSPEFQTGRITILYQIAKWQQAPPTHWLSIKGGWVVLTHFLELLLVAFCAFAASFFFDIERLPTVPYNVRPSPPIQECQ